MSKPYTDKDIQSYRDAVKRQYAAHDKEPWRYPRDIAPARWLATLAQREAEVRDLRNRLDAAETGERIHRESRNAAIRAAEMFQAERDEARAEVARLRGALDEACSVLREARNATRDLDHGRVCDHEVNMCAVEDFSGRIDDFLATPAAKGGDA